MAVARILAGGKKRAPRPAAELAGKFPDIDIRRILDLVVVRSEVCSPGASLRVNMHETLDCMKFTE